MTQEEFDAVKKELGLFQMNQLKANNEIRSDIEFVKDSLAGILALAARIKVLEEARVRQITLNEQLLKEKASEKPEVKRKGWWW